MALQEQRAAVSVDHGVALAPLHLLARIVAARPTSLSGLDALAIDHRSRWAGLAPGTLAVEDDEVVAGLPVRARAPRATRSADLDIARIGRLLARTGHESQPKRPREARVSTEQDSL